MLSISLDACVYERVSEKEKWEREGEYVSVKSASNKKRCLFFYRCTLIVNQNFCDANNAEVKWNFIHFSFGAKTNNIQGKTQKREKKFVQLNCRRRKKKKRKTYQRNWNGDRERKEKKNDDEEARCVRRERAEEKKETNWMLPYE